MVQPEFFAVTKTRLLSELIREVTGFNISLFQILELLFRVFPVIIHPLSLIYENGIDDLHLQ